MKEQVFTVSEIEELASGVFSMVLKGNAVGTAPGMFIDIKIDGLFLRRPISVCDYGEDYIKIVFKVVGKGTEVLSQCSVGDKFDVLYPLGNGFDLTKSGQNPVLVGGGVGLPPLYALAKELKKQGKNPRVVMGFNTASEIILREDFIKLLGAENVAVTTVDGTFGIKGFVVNADLSGDYLYGCGPKPMLKAVSERTINGELSFEERMGCGFGACMGCSIMTKNGAKRVCREGPVFAISEVIW